MPYSSFRPLYLCTFASNKSCLTEIHRKSQNLRPLPSHYLTLWEKLINSLFLIHSYFNIGFDHKICKFLSLKRRKLAELSKTFINYWISIDKYVFKGRLYSKRYSDISPCFSSNMSEIRLKFSRFLHSVSTYANGRSQARFQRFTSSLHQKTEMIIDIIRIYSYCHEQNHRDSGWR